MTTTIGRYVIEDTRPVPPFNEPASLLTIGTLPLKIHHETLLADFFRRRREDLVLRSALARREDVVRVQEPAIVYRDNLWFDGAFFDAFMAGALRVGKACRAAFPANDPAFRTYTLRLATQFERTTDTATGDEIILVDLWYLPTGYEDVVTPVVVQSHAVEKGFYSVPDFMATDRGDLTHYLPMRAVVSVESWVHVYFASVIFGVFARASRLDERIKASNFTALRLLWRALLEQRQLLSSSAVVEVGRGTVIHPTAIVTGPARIGENCTIGPGAVVDNCTIGNNVTIDDGCHLMMSTVGDNCFLPFRASLYLTAVMESTIVAQNTCLQMCVVGRNSFIGAGSTFTDFNLLGDLLRADDGTPLRTVPRTVSAVNANGDLEDVGQVVLGGAVGHNCRIGSGMIVYPGRMIESDVVLVANAQRRVVARSVPYAESDHLFTPGGAEGHHRRYPHPNDQEDAPEATSWETW